MGPRARVLVVDDEPIMCRYLRRVLENGGYEVETAVSGPDALDRVQEAPFEVAMIDIVMPGMDGIEVLRQIKQRSPDTVVIVMTGYSSLQHATEAIRHGAYRLLTKPFDGGPAVLEAIAQALTMHPGRASRSTSVL